MLELPGVTLLCVDTANHALALRALASRCEASASGASLFLTDALPPDLAVPAASKSSRIAPIASRDAYSQFVLEVAAAARRHAARAGDAVGRLRRQSRQRGNPRSSTATTSAPSGTGTTTGIARGQRRLLAALAQARWKRSQDPRIVARRRRGHDDRPHVPAAARARARHPLRRRGAGRPLLVRGGVSDRQAVRLSRPVQFLPHGAARGDRGAGARVLRRHRALAAAPAAPAQLHRAGAVGRRARDRAAHPRRGAGARRSAASLLARRERPRRSAPSVGRNDPCPCGSGKRYKQCHGALRAPHAGAAPAPAAAIADPDALRARRDGRAPARRSRRRRARLPRGAGASRRSIRWRRTISASSCTSAERFDEALPLLERRRRRRAGGARVPQQPGPRARGRGSQRRSDRRVPARARAASPDHAMAWNNLGLALQAENRLPEAIDAFRQRNRAGARVRAGALEPRPRAARERGIRGRLARIRVAPPVAGARALRARVPGAALGWRVDPPAARCC